MKVREVEYKNKKLLIIYVTKQEKNSENFNNIIDKCKLENMLPILFVSGEKNIENTLNAIINDLACEI